MSMKKVLDERLIYEILSVVEEIPEGKVATYGQIARLIGRDKNARLVGRVLGMSEFYGDYPCHRVVNFAGRTAPRMGTAAFPFRTRGREIQGGRLCGYEKIPLGLLNSVFDSDAEKILYFLKYSI